MTEPGDKWCPGCKLPKPANTTHWYVNQTCTGDLAPKCKACVKLHNARKRAANYTQPKQRVTRQGRRCPECYGTPDMVRGATCDKCGLKHAPLALELALRRFDHVS